MPPTQESRAPPRPVPAWLLVLVGALSTSAVLERLEAGRRRSEQAAGASAALLPGLGPPPGVGPSPTTFLARASARELRRLPGIGRRRAEAIVRARHEHGGGDFALGEVPGIGPGTVARVADWIAHHGRPPQSSSDE